MLTETPNAVLSSAPSTYEDCQTLIAALNGEGDVAKLKDGISKLESFFKNRTSKAKRDTGSGSTESVKKAIEMGRNFKKYEPKASEPAPTGNGSIFA